MTARAFRHDRPGTPPSAWQGVRATNRVDLLRRVEHLLVLSAHPDDETLGAGGLIAVADRRGIPVTVVAATAGEASHPCSPSHCPALLARIRRAELRAALACLAPAATLHLWALPDGRLAEHVGALAGRIAALLGPHATHTLVVAPYRGDGHIDHESLGQAAALAARGCGADLVEYPIWWWHWGTPAGLTVGSVRTVGLDEQSRRRKDRAMACHRSQTEPLSPAEGDATLLTASFLAHFQVPVETFVVGCGTTDAAADGAPPCRDGAARERERERC